MADAASDAAHAASEAARAAASKLPARIGFLGFGLIGGSIALALRQSGYRGRIAAWTPSGRGPGKARASGLLDAAAASAPAALDGAQLVVLAGPPLAVIDHIHALGGDTVRRALDPTATVTDVASTKGRIVAAADAAGLRFVGGHPMAGREVSGVDGARADLFLDRPWVIVPGAHASVADIDRIEALATATGARPIRMTAGEHDTAVAAISHLPLVVSAALVDSVSEGDGGTIPLRALELAATGWSSMTRLARGDAEMGAGILATNAAAVSDRLIALRDVLQRWIDLLALEGSDPDVLRMELERARRILEQRPG